jgi:HK97 family phage prohead protease
LKIEIRADKVVLEGYVNATEKASRVMPSPQGRFREYVEPGVFERALQKNDNVLLRFNHERDLGDTKDGSITLHEDAIGLYGVAQTADPEVRTMAETGKLRGWSFGMSVNKDRWEPGTDGIQKRYLENIDLYEVSLLTRMPAYIAMSLSETRDGEEQSITEQRDLEDIPEQPEVPAIETVEEHGESRTFLIPNAKTRIEIIKLRGGKTHE